MTDQPRQQQTKVSFAVYGWTQSAPYTACRRRSAAPAAVDKAGWPVLAPGGMGRRRTRSPRRERCYTRDRKRSRVGVHPWRQRLRLRQQQVDPDLHTWYPEALERDTSLLSSRAQRSELLKAAHRRRDCFAAIAMTRATHASHSNDSGYRAGEQTGVRQGASTMGCQ